MNILEFPKPAPPEEEDESISRRVCRSTAAQLLGLHPHSVKCRFKRGVYKITARAPEADREFNFRGASWFMALQNLHRFLVAQVIENAPEEEAEEDLKS